MNINNVKVKESGMKELYTDGYMEIFVNEQEQTLYYKIIGYPKFSEIIRQGHDKIYEIVLSMKDTSPIVNLVADLLEAKILLTRDIKMIATISYPRLSKAGIKNLSILLSEDVHVQINVEKTLAFMGTGIFNNVKLFDTLEEARNWFRCIT
jgi:hypothetical protein